MTARSAEGRGMSPLDELRAMTPRSRLRFLVGGLVVALLAWAIVTGIGMVA